MGPAKRIYDGTPWGAFVEFFYKNIYWKDTGVFLSTKQLEAIGKKHGVSWLQMRDYLRALPNWTPYARGPGYKPGAGYANVTSADKAACQSVGYWHRSMMNW